MGFFNDGLRSRSRSRSRTRSHSTSNIHSKPYYASRPSANRSTSSFISSVTDFTKYAAGAPSTSRGRSSYSGGHSRARPRNGFMARIRKFLRDLYSYMRRHPVKVFFLVIMPLITGGALTKILATFGVRLPRGLEQMVGGAARGNAERFYARGGARDFVSGSNLPGMMGGISGAGGIGGSGISMGDTVQSAMSIAKMFM